MNNKMSHLFALLFTTITVVLIILCSSSSSSYQVEAQTTQPGTLSVLSGAINVRWEYDGTYINWFLDTPTPTSSQYAAVALGGSSAMSGAKAVACQMPQSGATTATCKTYSLSNYAASDRTDAGLSVISASTSGSRSYVQVRATASGMGVSSAGTYRMIYAKGSWSSGVTQHSSGATNRGVTSSITISLDSTTSTAAAGTTTITTAAPTTTTAAATTTVTTAAATTTAAPTTTSTAGPATTQPGTISVLSGAINLRWEYDGTNLTFWLDTPTPTSSQYAAVALGGSSAMSGAKAVACQMPQSGGTSATCKTYSLVNYGASDRTDAGLSVISASTSGSRSYVQVRVTAAGMGVSSAGTYRMIYAKGSWSSGVTQHSSGATNRGITSSVTISLASTTTSASSPGGSTTTGPATTTAVPTTSTTAAPTTSTTAATTGAVSTTSTFVPSTTASGAITYLPGVASLIFDSWVDDNFTFTIDGPISTSSSNLYVAAGFTSSTSDTAMANGKIVGCLMPSTTSSSSSTCKAYTTSSYTVSARTDSSLTVLSASSVSSTGRSYVTVSLSASGLGLSSSGTYRILVASGLWSGNEITQHGSSSSARVGTTVTLTQTTTATTTATTGAGGSTQAPPTTTTTTTSTTHAASTTSAAPQTGNEYSSLGGQMKIQWEVDSSSAAAGATTSAAGSSSAGDNLTMTVTSTGTDSYKAVVWASASSGMAGVGFACVYLAGEASARIRDITTYVNGANPRTATPATKVLSAKFLSSGGWEMKVEASAKAMGLKEGTQRILFAEGTWNTGTNMPEPHNTAGRAAAKIDWFSGSATTQNSGHSDMAHFTAVLAVCFLVFILMGFVGKFLRPKHESSLPAFTQKLQIAGLVVVAVSLAGCIIAAHHDFSRANATVPVYRAFGAGCLYLFSVLLLPTTKLPTAFNLGHQAGSSYERFINFHVLTGLFLTGMILTHFGMMTNYFTKNAPFDKAILVTTGHHPPLYAFIGLILLLVMVICAMLRRKFYTLFRYSHLLFPVVLIMFVLHYLPLLFALLPGVLMYICDFSMRQYSQYCKGNMSVVEATAIKDAQVVKLRVKIEDPDYPEIGPAQFSLVQISSISMMPHPFSIAHQDSQSREVTFYIKNLNGPFTKRVFEDAQASKITAVSISRPIGQLGISLNAAPVVFLCAGGVGITPILSTAEYISKEIQRGSSSVSTLQTLHVIWSVREQDFIDAVSNQLQEIVDRIEMPSSSSSSSSSSAIPGETSIENALLTNAVSINIAIHKTGAKKEEMSNILGGGAGGKFGRSINTLSGRPKFGDLFKGARSSASRASKKISSSTEAESNVSVFACGPVPFLEDCKKHASGESCLFHAETFEL